MDTSQVSKTENGYTWSIASRISEALAEAERRYGERIQNWFYAGHEFVDGGPRIWYPGSFENPPRKHVVIQLSPTSQTSFHCALFELAHEVIHLLSPAWPRTASNLEEGLASHFADEYCALSRIDRRTQDPDYTQQRDLVAQILADDPTSISRLRSIEPCISSISGPIIRQHIPILSHDDATYLSRTWSRAERR